VSWSIRARLSLSYSALVLAVLATATVVIAGVESRNSLSRLDAELQRLNLTLGAVMLNEFGEGLDLFGAAHEASTEVVTPGRILLIAHEDGSIVRAWGGTLPASWRPDVASLTATAPLNATASLDAVASAVTLNGANYRMVERRVVAKGQPFLVCVLAPMAPLEEDQRSLFRTLTIGIAAALAVAVLGGLLIGKLVLRPLSAMAAQAAALGERNLTTRLAAPNPRDELGQLASAFNGLLGRLSSVLSSQRQFMADASHQLRTPVSVLRTTADVTLRQPDRLEHEYREAITIVAEQAVRLTKLVDAMFVLSRAEAGGRTLRPEPVYLDEIVADCVRELSVIAAERGVRVAATGDTDVSFVGDDDCLRQLFANLLDNAVAHTREGGLVTADTKVTERQILVRISDQGEGIPAAERERIFERFTRLDRHRPGAGLGLPIARWMAEAHGGTLELDSSSSEGSVFVVTLPSAARVDTAPAQSDAQGFAIPTTSTLKESGTG
jgi:two-component system, OmpR family, sensor kinase